MRTAQDLLAERRSLVREQMTWKDAVANAMLQFEIDQIDRELVARDSKLTLNSVNHPLR